MFHKSRSIFIAFITLSLIFTLQLLFLYGTQSPDDTQLQIKKDFVTLTTLPDLAISSGSTYIRHRSLAAPFDIYRDDPALLEYYPSTFTYKANR
jgi:hypothetical protein